MSEEPGTSKSKPLEAKLQEASGWFIEPKDSEECIYLEEPRKGKKLAVIDIDETIYDGSAPNIILATRPCLHTTLKNIYQEYDIGIWSATNMDLVESKLRAMHMFSNPNYKLLFSMSREAMVPARVGTNEMLVKSLEVVWSQYPQYDDQNTVICDDKRNNFILNPRNGIEVARYSYHNYNTDDELPRLGSYLMSIANYEDLSSIPHDEWRSFTEQPITMDQQECRQEAIDIYADDSFTSQCLRLLRLQLFLIVMCIVIYLYSFPIGPSNL